MRYEIRIINVKPQITHITKPRLFICNFIIYNRDKEKIVDGVRKAVQDFLVPELREVVGELKQVNKRLASVENSISELRADIREDRREVLQKIDDSHEKTREVLIEEIRKSAKLEVRIDEIEKRIGYVDQLNYRIQSIERLVAKEEG